MRWNATLRQSGVTVSLVYCQVGLKATKQAYHGCSTAVRDALNAIYPVHAESRFTVALRKGQIQRICLAGCCSCCCHLLNAANFSSTLCLLAYCLHSSHCPRPGGFVERGAKNDCKMTSECRNSPSSRDFLPFTDSTILGCSCLT